MKTLLTTLNAKYIHKSLSLRWLYVACKDTQDIDFKEYTIKDDKEHIIIDILKQQVDIVAFSVYIWNVELIKEICKCLKEVQPSILIILGGPEVSYDIDFFLDTFSIDYVISGEGEVALLQCLEQLEKQQVVRVQGISTKQKRDYLQTLPVSLSYIETLDSPYLLKRDIKDMKHRILYFETSRGCPYQCQYCLSSLEKGMRFFSKEYIKKQLDLLLQTEVKTIKFLDRSFNANVNHALWIIEYISKHHHLGQQFQFEINGDVLDQRILDVITKEVPKHIFRFEIGIQSTYPLTNEAVKRYQDFDRLTTVIQQLQKSQRVDLHLDLIAGLPLETLSRFAKSFDDVFAFQPKELQLGFLKLLRGTSLREEQETYGYVFDEKPPYEIMQSKDLSRQDIKDIHRVEDMVEKFWNSGKMPLTMKQVMQQIDSPFAFFLDLGKYYQAQGFKTVQYQNDELFSYFYQYISPHMNVLDSLLEDYLRLSKSKPKRWWPVVLTKEQTKQRMHEIIIENQLPKEVVFRYGRLERGSQYDFLAIYQNYQVQIYKYRISEE